MRFFSAAKQRLLDTMPHIVADRHTELCSQANSLRLGLRHDIERRRMRAARLAARLEALSPYQVLARGYLLSMDTEHRLITSRSALYAGQTIRLLYHDGEAGARIESTGDAI